MCFPKPSHKHKWHTKTLHWSQKTVACSVEWSSQNEGLNSPSKWPGFLIRWWQRVPRRGWNLSRHRSQYKTEHCSQYQVALFWDLPLHSPQSSLTSSVNTGLSLSEDWLPSDEFSDKLTFLHCDMLALWISWKRNTIFSKARFLGKLAICPFVTLRFFLHEGQSKPKKNQMNYQS